MNPMNTLNADKIYPAAPVRPVRAVKRKTRITIYLDDEVLEQFRNDAQQTGKGYQTLINAALRSRLLAQHETANSAS